MNDAETSSAKDFSTAGKRKTDLFNQRKSTKIIRLLLMYIINYNKVSLLYIEKQHV